MSRLGFKSVVYHGELCLGELDAIPVTEGSFQFPNNEIRIHRISQQSERCPPLSILQTISSFSVRCKLESSSPVEQPHLINLHASCFYEFKTATVLVGDEEIHLVAMPSKQKKFPCFWCYAVPLGLYSASLGMLNLRVLSIVFDLDETLIVANTMKSFEDRVETLRSWVARESDGVRMAGMSAEMKRYMDDRWLLKQYIDNDCVTDNGKLYKVQLEEVPPLSDNHEKIVRPIIRLPEKNIVLTRINPENRDTSVLVRLRPAWEDLRSYLTAKGRKRFEVYVCTMAERDYALEMWRLLDPGSHLIGSKHSLAEQINKTRPGENVLFTGEKIGFGMGRTRKDAQQQAAENALHSLADKYVAYLAPRSGAVDRDLNKGNENGFLLDMVGPGSAELLRDGSPKERTSEAAEVEPGSTFTVSQQVLKRASSPRPEIDRVGCKTTQGRHIAWFTKFIIFTAAEEWGCRQTLKRVISILAPASAFFLLHSTNETMVSARSRWLHLSPTSDAL
ncbi:hypothetical protein C1H46_033395 [Malus baccata]|uniref:protein-serine/threonine phosphatase n=1 Tax=Malus baccata TaxID=106549 RepID=A0A540L471_MALBA|nr:hypothetical protein C1H46_033395 [Malus baccata]